MDDEQDSNQPLISYAGDESPGPSHIDTVVDSPAGQRFAPISPVATKSPIKKAASKKKGSVISSVTNLCATAMGAGVLSLPHVLANCGAGLGVALIYFTAVAADMSCLMLVKCSRACHHYSMENVAKHYLGIPGYWFVNITLVVLLYGAVVLVMIVVMDLVPPVVQSATNTIAEPAWYSNRGFVGIIAVSAVFPINLLKSMTALKFTSGAALAFLFFFVCTLWAHLGQKMKDRDSVLGCKGTFMKGSSCYGLCGPRDGDNFEATMGDQCLFDNFTASKCYNVDSAVEIVQVPFFFAEMVFIVVFNIMSIDFELAPPIKPKIGRIVHIAMVGIAATTYAMGGLLGYIINGKCVANNLLKDFKADNIMTAVRAAIGMTNLFKIPLLLVPLRTSMNECLSNIRSLEGMKKPSDLFVAFETVVLYVIVFVSAYELKSISKDLDLLGCTCGVAVVFVLPGVLYLKFLQEERQKKMDAIIEEVEYADDVYEYGPIHDAAAWFMVVGGTIIGIAGIVSTLAYWNEA